MEKQLEMIVREELGLDEVDAVEVSGFFNGERTIYINSDEYLILTDEERDEFVREEIERSLFAFSPWFLAETTELDERVFEALSKINDEDAQNEALYSLIKVTCGFVEFCDDAVSMDGYGNFLSRYDGNEIELELELEGHEVELFLYRQN